MALRAKAVTQDIITWSESEGPESYRRYDQVSHTSMVLSTDRGVLRNNTLSGSHGNEKEGHGSIVVFLHHRLRVS